MSKDVPSPPSHCNVSHNAPIFESRAPAAARARRGRLINHTSPRQVSREGAAPAAEHEQMPLMRIAPQRLLHQQRQAVEALAHIGVAGREPQPCTARDRDHRRRSLRPSAVIAADTVAASTGPPMRSRAPVANSTSIRPGGNARSWCCCPCDLLCLVCRLEDDYPEGVHFDRGWGHSGSAPACSRAVFRTKVRGRRLGHSP